MGGRGNVNLTWRGVSLRPRARRRATIKPMPRVSLCLSPAVRRLGVAGALLGWSASLVLFRLHLDGQGRFLLWNLFLASLPLLWGAAFAGALAHGRRVLAALCLVLWMLFLPNAPYLLTDVLHLRPSPSVPLWYVLAMLLSCAATGTLLGYLSLMQVQAAIESKAGALAGWVAAVAALMACGFGIYLGRFLRWNSWDAFTHPLRLAKTIAGQFADAGAFPHPVPVTLIFGGGLVIGYVALRVLAAGNQEVLEARAGQGERAKFESALAKVRGIEPEERDRL